MAISLDCSSTFPPMLFYALTAAGRSTPPLVQWSAPILWVE